MSPWYRQCSAGERPHGRSASEPAMIACGRQRSERGRLGPMAPTGPPLIFPSPVRPPTIGTIAANGCALPSGQPVFGPLDGWPPGRCAWHGRLCCRVPSAAIRTISELFLAPGWRWVAIGGGLRSKGRSGLARIVPQVCRRSRRTRTVCFSADPLSPASGPKPDQPGGARRNFGRPVECFGDFVSCGGRRSGSRPKFAALVTKRDRGAVHTAYPRYGRRS